MKWGVDEADAGDPEWGRITRRDCATDLRFDELSADRIKPHSGFTFSHASTPTCESGLFTFDPSGIMGVGKCHHR